VNLPKRHRYIFFASLAITAAIVGLQLLNAFVQGDDFDVLIVAVMLLVAASSYMAGRRAAETDDQASP
jgi:hypothetical protein